MNRKKTFVLILFLNLYTLAFGQTNLDDVFSFDISIPDAPAFNIVQTDGDKILRPSSVRELAITISDFLEQSNDYIIPNTIGVELSPALLLEGSNLSINQYQKSPYLYRSRLSFAFNKDEEIKKIKGAFGIRLSIIDDADLRCNKNYLRDATKLAEEINQYVVAKYFPNNPALEDQKSGVLEYDSELKNIIEREYNKLINEYMDNDWNKQVLDIAYAFGIASMDSNYNNVKFFKHSLWVTYGDRISNWGQFLLGVNGNYGRDSVVNEFKTSGSVSGRMFMGVNYYKFYLEGVGNFSEGNIPIWGVNLGGEMKLLRNIWFNLKAGFEYDNIKRQIDFNSNFSFKLGFSNLLSF